MISDLKPAAYETARLREGGGYYLDRGPTITSLAPSYANWLWIKTADADRASSADSSREPTFLKLDPSWVNLASDKTVQFSAAILDQVGEPVAGQVDWTATGGAITSSGLYTAGQTPGNYSVTATEASTGARGSAGVTISDPGGGGGGRISGVTWACNNLITDAPGSDLWPITWSDDGHQYTSWGDGGGFQGSTKRSWGIARLEGDAPNHRATDLAEGPIGSDQGKIGPIISVRGVLYFVTNEQDGGNRTLRKSTDKAQTVSSTIFRFSNNDSFKFIQHGQDNSESDGYVYVTSASPPNAADPVYLVRVAESQIETENAWEWFTGTPSNPTWGTRANRRPIYSDPNATASYSADEVIITYFPPLRKYILTAHPDANMGEWSIHESDNLWGPWTKIASYNNWCNFSDNVVVLPRFIAPQWISADGANFWMVFSGTGRWDRFNLIEGSFRLQ